MNFTRRKRIALELLGPPLLGALYWAESWLLMMATQRPPNVKWPDWNTAAIAAWSVIMIIYAYLFAGLPSLAYTVIMEWRFVRGLDPRGSQSIGLSAILGLLSGVVIGSPFGFRMGHDFEFVFGWFGLTVGFTLGWLIRQWSARGSPAPG